LDQFDRIIVMEHGSIIANGRYVDIISRFPQYRKLERPDETPDAADDTNKREEDDEFALTYVDDDYSSENNMEIMLANTFDVTEAPSHFKSNISNILIKRQQSKEIMVSEDREKGLS
jgi:ABC-type multidrug transport system ATPase subunit